MQFVCLLYVVLSAEVAQICQLVSELWMRAALLDVVHVEIDCDVAAVPATDVSVGSIQVGTRLFVSERLPTCRLLPTLPNGLVALVGAVAASVLCREAHSNRDSTPLAVAYLEGSAIHPRTSHCRRAVQRSWLWRVTGGFEGAAPLDVLQP